MRWFRVALVAGALVAAAGCDRPESAGDTRTEPAPSLDCAYPLLWKDARYEPGIDLPASSRLGPEIGPGVVLGCGSEEMGYYPDEDVEVRRIEGVQPSMAVAARIESADRPFVWLGPGYLVESSRHPLHAAIASSWGLDAHEGFACGAGTSLEKPGVVAARPDAKPAHWLSFWKGRFRPSV